MISKEEVKPDRGRVTQGIPALDSPARFQHDSELVSRDYVRQIEAEQQRTVKLAVEKDGDRPINDKEACRGITLLPEVFIAKLSRLNSMLRFERSGNVPSQMMCCVAVPVSQDHPKGLRYIGGFPADRPISEMGYWCTKLRWMHTREGFLEQQEEPCGGCPECMFLRRLPGWRTVLSRLIEHRIITEAQSARAFGAPSIDSRNLQRFRNGS